jgi:RNA polymerase sigma-70 factor (ECF subfamily)
VRSQARHIFPLLSPGSATAASLREVTGVSEGGMARRHSRLRGAVGRHLALVWRVLRRAGLGPADAEDASQDVFWVLAQRIDDVPEKAERSFLVSTALRVALDCKRLKWHRSVQVSTDLETNPDHGPSPDRALELKRARGLLDEALASLSEAERAIFILAELEQMTRSEISEALRIPEGTVASRLARARQAFESALRRLRARTRTGV